MWAKACESLRSCQTLYFFPCLCVCVLWAMCTGNDCDCVPCISCAGAAGATDAAAAACANSPACAASTGTACSGEGGAQSTLSVGQGDGGWDSSVRAVLGQCLGRSIPKVCRHAYACCLLQGQGDVRPVCAIRMSLLSSFFASLHV